MNVQLVIQIMATQMTPIFFCLYILIQFKIKQLFMLGGLIRINNYKAVKLIHVSK